MNKLLYNARVEELKECMENYLSAKKSMDKIIIHACKFTYTRLWAFSFLPWLLLSYYGLI